MAKTAQPSFFSQLCSDSITRADWQSLIHHEKISRASNIGVVWKHQRATICDRQRWRWGTVSKKPRVLLTWIIIIIIK